MSAAAAPGQLALFGAQAAVVVRRSARARRLSLRVYPHGLVEVVAPQRIAERSIRRFVTEQQAWIERARRELGVSTEAGGVEPPAEIRLPAVGELWQVTYRDGARRLRSTADAGGGCIRLSGPADPCWRVQALRRWVQQRGRLVLAAWLADVARETGLSYRNITVRRQRSRWGSCSANHDISLNCALLFLDPALVRHVLVHELAHTRHLNHGPAFWRLVARLAPDFETAERELRDAWRRVPPWLNHDPL
ncbi:SprT family zinc-dependent metalloprotease [Wenzhouxiangella sp. XN24]|uniref:M48 family metallopeptidase n=1 Tax=Wenzhouxiangella sp. XN24 TaxID=2713569 RepID=UPI0013ECC147|nr:SprT family zinc-dependent metalloprotease [Wenzhouxiangella sp. XN24]NGX16619.1 M48 family metallopeptidase [Wenzhouxiangella sp. XN24]